MAKYLIHTYPKRLWYVNEYIIPSMLKQGIHEEDIKVYNDIDGDGNLRACMKAFASVDDNDESTWHLQDDVCICKDFKERTEMYSKGLIAGFSSALYDGPGKIGPVTIENMWFSFPCILIPNQYAIACSKWVMDFIIGNPIYERYWKRGVNDDWAFRLYIKNFHKNDPCLNIYPNLVDHVDYLLGGGSGGKRKQEVRAQFWKDDDVVSELEKKINGRC